LEQDKVIAFYQKKIEFQTKIIAL